MEDKLLMFKSLLMKHSEDISCANMIRDLQSVLKVNRKLYEILRMKSGLTKQKYKDRIYRMRR